MNQLASAVEWSHHFLSSRLKPGDYVIDATAGNGHDTKFLAQLVQPGGKVFAFDIQEQALCKTCEKLIQEGVEPIGFVAPGAFAACSLPDTPVVLLHQDHGKMDSFISDPVKAIVFNLGYLPGGEHQVKTIAATTQTALTSGAKLLALGGVLVVTVYTGHEGAEQEAQIVSRWFADLDHATWDTVRITFPNRRGHPPFVLTALKKEAVR